MISVFGARLTIIAALLLIGWYAVQPQVVSGPVSEYLTVSFLDVGQGDAIFIQTPDGYELLIDGGPTAQVLRELSTQKSFFDKDIEVVLATHPDTDHLGGLVDVLRRYNIVTLIETSAVNDTPASQAYDTAARAEGAQTIIAKRGDVINLGASTTVRILSPSGDTENWRSNAASVIVQVQYGDIEFMLTGDAPSSIEDFIAGEFGVSLESEVLKLGHHGSDTSTSELFLKLVDPQYAVVSAGLDNRYGHPHPDVVGRVERQGVQLVSTAESGTITFETDGVTVWQK